MDIGLLNILKTVSWDFRRDMAQSYANALKNAIELHLPNDREKQRSFFLSKKGSTTAKGNFEDKLYVGNIHRIENHLYWNDEELAEDDEIVNVVVIDGPVTRDGGGCSYGTKDYRDMVTYANTIPQVVGHIFFINTPGGESACRNDYDMMIDDCRKNGKPTVAFVDGMCCSSGVNLASRCDRVIVMNPKDDFGCIGSMAAFWATPDGAIDRDGTRFIEIVGDDSPDKNDWYREAAEGNYEKLREIINRDTEQFHQTVRENRPLVKAEMLTGKVFEAQELIPALVDEIGDFNRAIQAVFDLAGQTLTAARFATAEPEPKPEEQPEGEGQEDMAQLTEQQKATIATSRGDLRMVEDGHVTRDVETFFGPVEEEIATPKNNNDMTEQEKKAQEAAEEQPVTTQEQAPAQEETPAQEEQAPAAEGAPATEEKPAEEPAGEAAGTEAPAQEAAVADATAEVAKITETLHTAEAMIEQKDKEIAQLNSTLEGKQNEVQQLQEALDGVRAGIDQANAAIAEKDATIAEREKTIEAHVATITEKDTAIEALKKQVSDLKAEVKELSEKPAPMVNAESGIPADNGTGDAPQQQKPRITSDMTYEEIRAMKKKAAEGAKKEGK
ncbi:MAG: S49 family peptidase [Prevotella sp.]|nr:S49 family peptidase [Prevotella sp.]